MRSTARNCLLAIACALASAIGWAQGRNVGFDWPATGADAQRTGWLRLDPNISVENLSKPGFEFLWREKLDNAPRQSASLSQGVTMNGLIGFTPASFVTGASNNVFAIDNDTGYPSVASQARCTASCANGAMPGRRHGRCRPRRQPRTRHHCNCLRPRRRAGDTAAASARPAKVCRWKSHGAMEAPRCVARRPSRRPAAVAEVCSRADMQDQFTLCRATARCTPSVRSRAVDLERPAPFLPPNARYSDLTAIDEHVVHEHQPRVRRRREWRLGDHSGSAEQDRDARGKRTAAARSAISRSRQAAGFSSPSGQDTDSPVDTPTRSSRSTQRRCSRSTGSRVRRPSSSRHRSSSVTAVARSSPRGARRRIFLLDAAALGGANHSTPLFVLQTDNSAADALATFEQPAGNAWLLVPGPRGIVAFRIVDEGGKTSLQRGWASRDLVAPTAPIVVNDVVFAASSGRPQGSAVLYAFDSRSGRELWNSGQTMTSYVPPGNLWASNSQVHVGTYDGTVYAFGYALERR